MEKIDTETRKIMSDGEKLRLMLEHEGWVICRQKLVDKIIDLQSIKNLEHVTDPQSMFLDVKSRALAVDILYSFLKEDIEGTVQQHINNSNPKKETKKYLVNEE